MWRLAYRNQYDDWRGPWPKSVFGWMIWLIFFMPGSIALWINYMYPRRGQVWASGRQAQNRIVTVITSLGIYFMIGMLLLLFVAMRNSHH
jgi:hypothetical protein